MASAAHVVKSGIKWVAKVDGVALEERYTQNMAIQDGREWLQEHGGGELFIHGEDGAVRAKDTIYPGNDPRNIRG